MGDIKMDKEKYIRQMISFYAGNFYLEKIPLEINQDEELDLKVALMQDKDHLEIAHLVTAGLSLVNKTAPIEVIISADKKYFLDKESKRLLKELQKELMNKEYKLDDLNGSIIYPSEAELYPLSEEFESRFGKAAFALAVRNGGDPVFISEDEDEVSNVAFVLAPIFLTREQYEEAKQLIQDDEDEYFSFILDELDTDLDASVLK